MGYMMIMFGMICGYLFISFTWPLILIVLKVLGVITLAILAISSIAVGLYDIKINRRK